LARCSVAAARACRLDGPLTCEQLFVTGALDRGAFCRGAVLRDGYDVNVGELVHVEGIDLDDPDSDARIVGVGLPTPARCS
jgi:hypothetical protein